MLLFEFDYEGKKLEFRMSHKAKVELEKISKEKQKIFEDQEVLGATLDVMDFANVNQRDAEEKNKEDSEEKKKLIVKHASVLSKVMNSMDDIDPVDMMYVLLHCNPKIKDITKEEWDNIEFTMEEEIGYEELMDIFYEIRDKVFTLLEKMAAPRQKAIPETKLLN